MVSFTTMADLIATYRALGMARLAGIVPMFGDDPFGVTSQFSAAYHDLEGLRQGIVVNYVPTTHTASVLISGSSEIWPCVFADEHLSFSFGFSCSHPPREGETVLVQQISEGVHGGVIMGRVPYPQCFCGTGDPYNDPCKWHRMLYTQMEGTEDYVLSSMMKPFHLKGDPSTPIATHFRPTDVYPGEFAQVNQHNCGIKGGMFSATLLGGGAVLRLSALANSARLSCDIYARHSMSGSFKEFHNGRYLSTERDIALYQEERLGGSSPAAKVWTEDATAPAGGENQTMRPRIKELGGYFGNLRTSFVLRPDPNADQPKIRVQGEGGSPPKDQGVCRETTDPSGQYRLSAAGMLAIERTGRIPVPVRNCYPTDNGHQIDKGEGPSDMSPEVLKPFEHDQDDPCLRQLELFDRQAYDLKNQYARVDGLGSEAPDYDVPQEEEMDPLEDPYDREFQGNETVKLAKFDRRRAGMYIGEDGSVIVRDAWGSEIVMLGGNVTISCAGNVMLLPGRTQLTIAGDDIVQKAQNSVDIHASAHDVRLSAARNMEIVGGGDDKEHSGGVVIESRGHGVTTDWSPYPDMTGESALVSGITLKTNNQSVVVDGKVVNIRAKEDMRVISGNTDIDGSISVAAKNIRSIAKTTIIAGAPKEDDDSAKNTRASIRNALSRAEDSDFGASFDDERLSAITVSQENIMTVARSIGLFADNSLSATKGTRVPVPMTWTDIGDNVAEIARGYIAGGMKSLSTETDASGGFNRRVLDNMTFTFRTSEQCGTDRAWSIGGPTELRLYEPAWIQVMHKYETLSGAGVDAKPYEEKAEWDHGLPWPGIDVNNNVPGKYMKLEGLEPRNLTKDGFNVRRDEVEPKSAIADEKLSGGYLVRK